MSYESYKTLVCFIVVLSMEIMQCKANVKSVKFRQISYLSGVLPTSGSCYVSELNDIELIECSLRCLEVVCAGVFYNDNMKSCKLMRRSCNENLLYVEHEGWNFISDMSSCSEGWIQYMDHCYILKTTPTSWNTARLQCQGLGSYLVEIESREEEEWIRKIIVSEIPSVNGTWTGGTVFGNEHSFIWYNSKKELNYTNWEENEPNNASGDENCLVIIIPEETWFDNGCEKQYSFLCEKKYPF